MLIKVFSGQALRKPLNSLRDFTTQVARHPRLGQGFNIPAMGL